MKKIFNTEFEVSMRLLILIDTIGFLNEDELAYLDFFSIYSHTFNLGNDNLNGVCSFPLNELTLQRKLIKRALKLLALKSFIRIVFDNEKGYTYTITNEGHLYVSRIDDFYSRQYQQNVQNIQKLIFPINTTNLKIFAANRRED